MDIDITNVAAINPERRKFSFANRTTAIWEPVEAELMVGVFDVAEAVGKASAK